MSVCGGDLEIVPRVPHPDTVRYLEGVVFVHYSLSMVSQGFSGTHLIDLNRCVWKSLSS